MQTITIAQIKGGVGKTKTATHLAAGLAIRGKKVLVVDLDPQSNASTILGAPTGLDESQTIEAVLRPHPIMQLSQLMLQAGEGNLFLAPARIQMAKFERSLYQHGLRLFFLKNALKTIADSFDYCVIDTPPHIGAFTESAIFAANLVIAPLPAEDGALQGFQDLQGTIVELNTEGKPTALAGLVTKFDGRTKKTNGAMIEAASNLGVPLLDTRIQKSEAINQAGLQGALLFDVQRNHPVCGAYKDLADEMIELFEEEQEENVHAA